MEHVWILTNGRREFVKACSSRENAKIAMEMWREDIINSDMFPRVSNLDAVYADTITFTVTDRYGKEYVMTARETILY